MDKKKEIVLKEPNKLVNGDYSEVLFYTTPEGKVKVEILLYNENLWLSQARIAELFGVERSVVTKHLKNIYQSGELDEKATRAKIAQVQTEGNRQVTRNLEFYNLDVIISVGYRVNSRQATLFRIWATERLKEYLIKGFTMNDERLKNPQNLFGKDFFEEQLERIRDIRSSERRFYQKITDIYCQCSADYDVNSQTTKDFFASVQNKLHYAVTHQTAAEIVYSRANSGKNNMGLTTWKNAPQGKIRKPDVTVAKNYLSEDEISKLNLVVSAYLDFAELQAKNGVIMYMTDWAKKLDGFLDLSGNAVLPDKGKISAALAKEHAESEFDKYAAIQDGLYESDFDKMMKALKSNKK